jgi:hypothetical protein
MRLSLPFLRMTFTILAALYLAGCILWATEGKWFYFIDDSFTGIIFASFSYSFHKEMTKR